MKILIDRDELVRVFKSRRAFYCDENPESFRKLNYSDKCRVDMLDTCIADVFNMPKYKSLSEELEDIKAEIGLYENDCMLACPNNDDCRDCNNNMFGSIYRIIDKHIKENKP